MADSLVECPRCAGERERRAFVRRPDGWRWDDCPCPCCGGAGTIPAAYARMIAAVRAAGRALLADRKARGESLIAAAARLDTTVAELSARELGRGPWDAPCQ